MQKVIPNFSGRRYIVDNWYEFIEGQEVSVPDFVVDILRESHKLINTLPPKTFWITRNILFEILPGQILFGRDAKKPLIICKNCNKKVTIIKTTISKLEADWCQECGRLVRAKSVGKLDEKLTVWLENANKFISGDLHYLPDYVGTRRILKYNSIKKRWEI